jgi:hypothetical protein
MNHTTNTSGNMRRNAARAALSLVTVAASFLGFAAASAGTAQAAVTNCTWTFEDGGRYATWAQVKCAGGSSYYRAWVKCPDPNASGGYKTVYGPTVLPGKASRADCGTKVFVDYGKQVFTYPPGT